MMYDMASERVTLVALSIGFWFLAAACTIIRIYGRIKLDDSRFKSDDWAIVAALIAYTLCCAATVAACYPVRIVFGPQEIITNVSYVLTVVLAKLSMGLYHRRQFLNDTSKMVGAFVVTSLIVIVGLAYLVFSIVVVISPAALLSQQLYSTTFSYAYAGVSVVWLLTNAITDLCISGMAICNLISSSTSLGIIERRIWIAAISCLGLGSAASWSAIVALTHHLTTIANLLQALCYLNRAGGVYIAASSCVIIRRLLRSSSPAPIPPQTPIMTTIATTKHTRTSLDGKDARSIRRLTTITIHDDSMPADLISPMGVALPSWQDTEFREVSEIGAKRSSKRSAHSARSIAAAVEERETSNNVKRGSTLRRPSSNEPPWVERLNFTSKISIVH